MGKYNQILKTLGMSEDEAASAYKPVPGLDPNKVQGFQQGLEGSSNQPGVIDNILSAFSEDPKKAALRKMQGS